MKQKDAAEQVLKKKGRPMHVKDIAEQAVGESLIESNNPDVKSAFGASIRTDIKNRGKESRFVKVEWAGDTYGLREWPDELLDEGAHAARKKNSDGAGGRSHGYMTYKDAAHEILLDEGGPLHKDEIAKRAKERGLIKPTMNTRVADAIAAQIGVEIKRLGTMSKFDRKGPSTYVLRSGQDGPPPDVGKRSFVPGRSRGSRRMPGGPPPESKGPDYTGPAGEHMVQAELLFRKYQTSKPEPDIGVDIVANKDGKEFHIQVKSSNKEEGSYHYNIKKSSFERTKKKNVYYVFVMRSPDTGRVDFVIMPRNAMLAMIKENKITTVNRANTEDSYQVNLKMVGGTAQCKGQKMAEYTNTWTIE